MLTQQSCDLIPAVEHSNEIYALNKAPSTINKLLAILYVSLRLNIEKSHYDSDHVLYA